MRGEGEREEGKMGEWGQSYDGCKTRSIFQ